MNRRISLAVFALVALIGAGLALAAEQTTTKTTTTTHSTKMATLLPAENLKWTEMPNAGGVMVAKVSGDMTKGAYTCFAKFPAGSMHPLHTHTYDIKCVVVSGTMVYAPDHGTQQKFGPGSYLMIPGGVKHTSGADAGSDVVLFQMQTAKFDMVPASEKSASAQ